MKEENKLWFPAKKYGLGWGPPTCWQGWLVLVAYILLVIAAPYIVPPAESMIAYVLYLCVVSLALLVTCFLKGEKPRGRK